jgi:hypothetical protein
LGAKQNRSRGVKNMRRKLIKQDAFDRIISESVTTAERELVEVEPILARAMGKDFLSLKSFTESTCLYETHQGTYVHAGYEFKNGQITFNNVEELVIDESSQIEKRKAILSDMIDAVLVDDAAKANGLFEGYLGMVRWNESKENKKELPAFLKKKGKKDEDGEDEEKDLPPFMKKKDKKEDKLPAFLKKGKDKKDSKKHDEEKKNHLFKKAKKAGKDIAEAYMTSQNVLDYVEFMKIGPTLAEAATKVDEQGNLTDIRIPSRALRNEAKLQRFDWKVLNAKAMDCRKKIPYFCESQDFCKAIVQLKRQNAFSDAQGLEEALDHIVKNFPEILYATQSEVAQIVAEALNIANITNFDDETCEFMAEGILRKAHSAYTERVAQLLHLASAPKMQEGTDAYAHFQSVVEGFFPALDEKFGLERKVFADLYESIDAVYAKANRRGDNATKNEAASYLNDLAAVLNEQVKPELALAEDAAEFLANIIETNLESGVWVVSNTPHMTVNGDHPDMAKKAAHGYSPSKDFSGNYGDPLPAIGSDDMKYKGGKHAKDMRHKGWGQEGGNEVFPSLTNPYIPKPFGDYTMKGEMGVDKSNSGLSLDSSSDTWPNLKNPYLPKEAGATGGKGHKMKNGKDTDLVVDR